METIQTTVCYICKHFHNEEQHSSRKDVCYNHFCKANPLPIEMNPVTGLMQAKTQNDFGTTVWTDAGFRFCRDINTDGQCEQFERNQTQ